MDIDMYFAIAILGQMLGGVVMAVGVIIGGHPAVTLDRRDEQKN